jgi:hypothetical protein
MYSSQGPSALQQMKLKYKLGAHPTFMAMRPMGCLPPVHISTYLAKPHSGEKQGSQSVLRSS